MLENIELRLYLLNRWMKLSPEAKRILGLNQCDAFEFTRLVWTKEFYERRQG
jgi:hypothetical protein